MVVYLNFGWVRRLIHDIAMGTTCNTTIKNGVNLTLVSHFSIGKMFLLSERKVAILIYLWLKLTWDG